MVEYIYSEVKKSRPILLQTLSSSWDDVSMSTSEKTSYRWSPLGQNAFRVLQILSLEPEVSVELHDHSFDNPPEYHAISYAWGDQAPTEFIFCNGQKIAVTKHLRECLKCAVSVSKCDHLWVDAININQEDENEKAHQVSNMYRIFGNATSVVVWLGASEAGSDIAMTAIDEVKDKLDTLSDDTEKLFDVLLHMKTHERYKIFNLSHYEPLANLSNRTWFQRLWVAQEFIVGRSITIVCGLKAVDGKDFVNVLRQLTTLSFGGQQPDTSKVEGEPFHGFRMLTDINNIKTNIASGDGLSFFDLVMFGRQRDTYEPLDHLYAVLGLAQGQDDVYRSSISIDYSEASRKSYWKAYVDFGKVALLHEPHLKLLSFTTSEETPPDLPSWCPNLNSAPKTSDLTLSLAAGWPFQSADGDGKCLIDSAGLLCAIVHPGFKDKAKCPIKITDGSNLIGFMGAKLDRVSVVGPSFSWGPDINTDDLYSAQPFAEGLLEFLKACEVICSPKNADSKLAASIFEDVLVGATDPKHERKWASDPGQKDSTAYEFLKGVLTGILDLEPQPQGRVQNPKLYDGFENVLAWIVVMQEDWYNRTIFATENGWLGKASEDIEVGDIVCMLYSGRSMYILREAPLNPDTHSFVSDAYVYRLMNGEMFEMMHNGDTKEEVFMIE